MGVTVGALESGAGEALTVVLLSTAYARFDDKTMTANKTQNFLAINTSPIAELLFKCPAKIISQDPRFKTRGIFYDLLKKDCVVF
jgi:hypothetical protein